MDPKGLEHAVRGYGDLKSEKEREMKVNSVSLQAEIDSLQIQIGGLRAEVRVLETRVIKVHNLLGDVMQGLSDVELAEVKFQRYRKNAINYLFSGAERGEKKDG